MTFGHDALPLPNKDGDALRVLGFAYSPRPYLPHTVVAEVRMSSTLLYLE